MGDKVVKGKKLLLVSLALFLLSNFIDIAYSLWMIKDILINNVGSMVGIFFRVCLIMGMVMEASKGLNWARWGVIILSIITTVFSIPSLILLLVQDLRGFIVLIMLVLNIIAFTSMIFQKDIKEYYRNAQIKSKNKTTSL